VEERVGERRFPLRFMFVEMVRLRVNHFPLLGERVRVRASLFPICILPASTPAIP
jgi:hypothetical protein